MTTPPTRRELEEQRDDALRHYESAIRTYASGLEIDWEYVCFRMARTLAPAGDGAGMEALCAALSELEPLGDPPEVLEVGADAAPGRAERYTRHP